MTVLFLAACAYKANKKLMRTYISTVHQTRPISEKNCLSFFTHIKIFNNPKKLRRKYFRQTGAHTKIMQFTITSKSGVGKYITKFHAR